MMCAEAAGFEAGTWSLQRMGQTPDHDLVLELYDREQLSLRRYLIYLGIDVDSATETVQETFLRLQQHLLAGGDRSNLRAWLYRVAHNLARNAQTSVRGSKTAGLDGLGGIEMVDQRVSAEEELLEQEGRERVREALGTLSLAQQKCLVLRSQGLRYREIADALGLSTSTVAENVQRGLEKLKRLV